MTKEQLRAAMPYATKANVDLYYPYLVDTMKLFHIDNNLRKAAFLAQIAHESGSLKYTREIYTGEKYDVGRLAEKLGNTPEDDGDGELYRGRGLIQVTGKANYASISKFFGIDFLNRPEILEKPEYACKSAGWYWHIKKLNTLADVKDMRKITLLINGGYNGLDERLRNYRIAMKALTK